MSLNALEYKNLHDTPVMLWRPHHKDVTWGLTKVVAVTLLVLALPSLIGGLLIVGGIALLLPMTLVGVACGILKTCV